MKAFCLLLLIGSAFAFAIPAAFGVVDSNTGSGKRGIASGVQACVDTRSAGSVGNAAVSSANSHALVQELLNSEAVVFSFCQRFPHSIEVAALSSFISIRSISHAAGCDKKLFVGQVGDVHGPSIYEYNHIRQEVP